MAIGTIADEEIGQPSELKEVVLRGNAKPLCNEARGHQPHRRHPTTMLNITIS